MHLSLDILIRTPEKRVWVGDADRRSIVAVSHEHLPIFCYKCKRICHDQQSRTSNNLTDGEVDGDALDNVQH